MNKAIKQAMLEGDNMEILKSFQPVTSLETSDYTDSRNQETDVDQPMYHPPFSMQSMLFQNLSAISLGHGSFGLKFLSFILFF